MGAYTMIAAADLAFLVVGYLVMRRLRKNLVLGIIIGPLWWFGLLYLVLFLSFVLPGCPDGRWAC